MAKGERERKNRGEAGEKKGNPMIAELRKQYAKSLSEQGMPKEQVKEKVRAHIKEVVKPALSAAKATAAERNLRGPAKRKFIQDEVRSKAGQPA